MSSEEMKSKLKSFFMSDLGVDGDVLQYDTALSVMKSVSILWTPSKLSLSWIPTSACP